MGCVQSQSSLRLKLPVLRLSCTDFLILIKWSESPRRTSQVSSQFVPELNIALTCVTDSQKIPTDDVRPLTSLQGLVSGSTSLLGRRGHPHSCTRVFHLTRIGRDDERLGGDVTNSFLRKMSSPFWSVSQRFLEYWRLCSNWMALCLDSTRPDFAPGV